MSNTSSGSVLEVTASVVNQAAAELGESPLWDDGVGLRLVDVPGRRLFTLTPDGTETVVALCEMVTAVEPDPSGALLAVTGSGFGTLDPATGHVAELVRVLHDDSISMNDGAVDAQGACWAGSAVRDGSTRGALYRFDGTAVTTQLTGLGTSNGLDWSPAADVFYHVDTGAGTLTAWDCDVASGTLGASRVLRTLAPDDGLPDGLTVDADGDIWLAIWGHGEVWRIDPDTGATTGIVTVPTRYPTSNVLGGSNLSMLFITSAAHENAPDGGLVYAVEVPARGRQPHRFAGDPR